MVPTVSTVTQYTDSLIPPYPKAFRNLENPQLTERYHQRSAENAELKAQARASQKAPAQDKVEGRKAQAQAQADAAPGGAPGATAAVAAAAVVVDSPPADLVLLTPSGSGGEPALDGDVDPTALDEQEDEDLEE